MVDSAGRLGTARASYSLRQVFIFLNGYVVNKSEVMVGGAGQAFDENDDLCDDGARDLIGQLLLSQQAQPDQGQGGGCRGGHWKGGALTNATMQKADMRGVTLCRVGGRQKFRFPVVPSRRHLTATRTWRLRRRPGEILPHVSCVIPGVGSCRSSIIWRAAQIFRHRTDVELARSDPLNLENYGSLLADAR